MSAQRAVNSERVQVMQVLDLLLDIAYHDGTRRELAVAAEAYTLHGYGDAAILIGHSGTRDELLRRIASARYGLQKALLRHDAQGVLHAVTVLVREGLVDGNAASNRENERWKERGGHDR